MAGLFFPGLFKLKIALDINNYFLESDPVQLESKVVEKLFANNDYISVLVQSDDVFSRSSLEVIKKLGDELQKVPFANGTVSIAQLDPSMSGRDQFTFEGDQLVDSPERRQEIADSYRQSPTLDGTLFSDDGKEAWVIVPLTEYPPAEEWTKVKDPQAVAGEVAYEIVRGLPLPDGVRLTPTGPAIYTARKTFEMLDDLKNVIIVGAIVALLLTLIILRNAQSVVGTFVLILFAFIFVLGFFGHLNYPIDQAFLSILLLLTMGVSISYTVHIHHFFILNMVKTGDRKISVANAIDETRRPILFTALTTMAAMLSFLLIRIKPIQWVGYASALSLLIVYFLCLTIFPIFLSFGKNHKEMTQRKTDILLENMFSRITQLISQRKTLVLTITCVIAAISLWGMVKVRVDFNFEEMTGTKLQHMKEQRIVTDSKIGANDLVYLVLDFKEAKGIKDLEVLRKIDLLQKRIDELPLVKRTISVNEGIREFNRLRNGGDKNFYKIPESNGRLTGLLLLWQRIAKGALSPWTTPDYKATQLRIELTNFSSKQLEQNFITIRELVAEIFPEDTPEVLFNGPAYLMTAMNQLVTKGLISSLFITLLFIVVLVSILFRSVLVGLVAMVPNLLPIIICGAIVGFFDIPLEFITMTIAPMILGLAIDNVIHFLFSLKKECEQREDYDEAIKKTFIVVGEALIKTTIILSCTFMAFTVSQISSLVYMGILTTVGIIVAFTTNILITPILIKWLHPFHLKEQKKEKPSLEES